MMSISVHKFVWISLGAFHGGANRKDLLYKVAELFGKLDSLPYYKGGFANAIRESFQAVAASFLFDNQQKCLPMW
jgi:hypothetical protein